MQNWFTRHTSWIKVVVWLVFAVWIAKPVVSYFWHTNNKYQGEKSKWSGRLEDLDHDKLEAFKAEIAKIRDEAEAKGAAYGQKSWLFDYARIYDLATIYGIPHDALVGSLYQQILGIDQIYYLAVNNNRLMGREMPQSETCEEAIYAGQVRLAVATGEEIPRPPQSAAENRRLLVSWLPAVFWFFFVIYLKMTLFCLFWYPLRLIDPWRGGYKTTLRDELVLAPGRFIKAVVFWPIWFKVYGRFTDPAKAMRYARLKIEYLRQKKGFEQLLPHEEEMLRREAEQPLANFERALARLKTQERAVKRSLVAAMLWFLLGLFFSPFVSPRGRIHQAASFCGAAVVQLVIEQAPDRGAEVNKIAPRAPPDFERQAIVEWLELPERPLRFVRVRREEPLLALKDVFVVIDHVPRCRRSLQFANANGGWR